MLFASPLLSHPPSTPFPLPLSALSVPQSYAKASELVGVRPSPAAFAAVAAVSGRLLLHLLRARLTLFRALKLTLLAVLLSSSSSAPSSSSPSLPPPSSPLSSSSLPPSLSSLLLTQSPPIAAALGSLVSSYWTLGSEVLHLAASLLPLLPAALPASFAPRLTALLTRLRSTP